MEEVAATRLGHLTGTTDPAASGEQRAARVGAVGLGRPRLEALLRESYEVFGGERRTRITCKIMQIPK